MKSVSLGSVVAVRGGGTPRKSVPEYYGGGIPWVTPKDMKRPLIGSSAISLSEVGIRNSPARLVPAGSVLVVVRSGVLKHTLPVALTSVPVSLNQDMKALIPSPSVESSYLARLLKARESEILGWVRATTADNFPIQNLLDLEIDLPPLAEQRRIAAILDHADALRAKRRQVLAHLDALTQSIFHNMFDGSRPHWATVGEVAAIQGGLQVSKKRASLPMKVPYLRVANAQRGYLDLSEIKSMRANEAEIERTRLARGDLLFVEGHANPKEVGRVALWTGQIDGCVHQNHLIRGRFDTTQVHPVYAAAWLNSDAGARHFRMSANTTSGLNTISTSTVRNAPLPIVPLERQHGFVRRVEAVHGVRTLASTDALEELFAALQARAFNGEL